MLLDDGRYEPIVDARIETEWAGEDRDHAALRCLARTAERELEIDGTVRSLIPLRHRREGGMTRIGEGLTEYRWDGKVGYGLSEYLDQLRIGCGSYDRTRNGQLLARRRRRDDRAQPPRQPERVELPVRPRPAAAVEWARDDDEVRAVLITGAGRGFSSGADLRETREDDLGPDGKIDLSKRLRERYHPILIGIREMPKPVVTAVNGPAVGIGCSLALDGDLVVAAESSYFLLAFVNIGLIPDGGSTALRAGPRRPRPRGGDGDAR